MSIFTRAFWRAAGERAIKTAAQSAILVIAADQVNALTVQWDDVGGFALGGAILSLLMSIGSDALTAGSGPSLTNSEVLPQKRILGKAVAGRLPDERGASTLEVCGLIVAACAIIWLVVEILAPRI